jgi:penicillin amidase
MWSASKLIKRGANQQGKTYSDGSSGLHEFNGFYDFSSNPSIINPENGFIVSANQMHDSTEGVLYPGYYCSNNRYDRISSELAKMRPATVDSMKSLLFDVKSDAEMENAHVIAAVIDTSGEVLTAREEEALALLRAWNGQHRLRDQEPTLYYKVLYYICKRAYSDELGMDNFEAFLNTHLFHRSYPKLLREDNSPWWDDIKTKGKSENRSDVFLKAFRKALSEITDELGEDLNEWRWERVHTTQHEHPMGKVDMLAPFFNVGPFPTPGGHETINNAGFILNGEGAYRAHFGPAMRIVIDFADVENAYSVLPTGNSGNIMSPHYKDQAEMYNRGEFRKMMMNEKEIKSSSNVLEISPK